MRSPETGKVRGATPGPNPQNNAHHAQDETSSPTRRNRTVLAFAHAYPPSGRRQYWLLLVVSCPLCHGTHHHRGGRAGGLRQASCGRGQYMVRPHRARRLTDAEAA